MGRNTTERKTVHCKCEGRLLGGWCNNQERKSESSKKKITRQLGERGKFLNSSYLTVSKAWVHPI